MPKMLVAKAQLVVDRMGVLQMGKAIGYRSTTETSTVGIFLPSLIGPKAPGAQREGGGGGTTYPHGLVRSRLGELEDAAHCLKHVNLSEVQWVHSNEPLHAGLEFFAAQVNQNSPLAANVRKFLGYVNLCH
eukprot:TRINITY_DN18509_c0_g1_i1.p1 TRINITY_DN18509_c0_g1~~TRINITY_DN18509_c0_g1_i1.p1  ORF type:complete len:131 (+),score=1.05 TRINITY_DN18509_c0_g1_i1:66-458(+)